MSDPLYELKCSTCQKVLGTTTIKNDEKHLCGDCGVSNLNSIQQLRDEERRYREGREAVLEMLWNEHVERSKNGTTH